MLRAALPLCIVGLLIAGAAHAQAAPAPAQPAPPAPAPAELTLEKLLAQRGWSAVQLRENAFSQLEVDALANGEHRLRVQISTSFTKTIFDGHG